MGICRNLAKQGQRIKRPRGTVNTLKVEKEDLKERLSSIETERSELTEVRQYLEGKINKLKT